MAVDPHGEEAQRAVWNHEARASSFETPLAWLLRVRGKSFFRQ